MPDEYPQVEVRMKRNSKEYEVVVRKSEWRLTKFSEEEFREVISQGQHELLWIDRRRGFDKERGEGK